MIKTVSYNSFTIEPKIHNKGYYYILVIEQIWIPNDKSERECSDIIIEFGQRFSELEDVEKFQKTKLYKSILKATLKNLV